MYAARADTRPPSSSCPSAGSPRRGLQGVEDSRTACARSAILSCGYIARRYRGIVERMRGRTKQRGEALARVGVASRLLRQGLRGGGSRGRGGSREEIGSGVIDAGQRGDCTAQGGGGGVREGRGASTNNIRVSNRQCKIWDTRTRVPKRRYAKLVSLLCTSSLSTPNTIPLLIKVASG